MRRWFPIWIYPVLIVFSVGTVWLRLSIVRTAYAINQTEAQEKALRKEREGLELKVTALRSPRRLESLAHARFGLGVPRSDQIIHLSESGSAP